MEALCLTKTKNKKTQNSTSAAATAQWSTCLAQTKPWVQYPSTVKNQNYHRCGQVQEATNVNLKPQAQCSYFSVEEHTRDSKVPSTYSEICALGFRKCHVLYKPGLWEPRDQGF